MTHTKLFLMDQDLVRWLGFEGVRGHHLQEEVCGFVVKDEGELDRVAVQNEDPKESRRKSFSFHFPGAIRELIERKLLPLAIYHTHLFASPNLSGADVKVMAQTGLDMVVISLISNEVRHYTRNHHSFPCIETAHLNLLEHVHL